MNEHTTLSLLADAERTLSALAGYGERHHVAETTPIFQRAKQLAADIARQIDAAPKRHRLSRRRGWRMPDNTVKVDRSTPWGNPFRREWDGTLPEIVRMHRLLVCDGLITINDHVEDQRTSRTFVLANLHTLAGRNLACWCLLCAKHKAGKPFAIACPDCAPCHADTLGMLANRIIPVCEATQ